jgi:ABC-type nickel/cobalt efflux system permease component RcnA
VRDRTKSILFVMLLVLCMSRASWAHPMGNFSVNHYSKIDLQAKQISVQYFIDLAEIPAYQELQQGNISADAKAEGVTRYVANRGRELGRKLILTINGLPVPLQMISSGVIFPAGAGGLPTMKMGFVYKASYPSGMDAGHVSLHYVDDNFQGHAGWKEIIAVASAGSLPSSSVSTNDRSHELSDYPTDLLNSPPQDLEASLVAKLALLVTMPEHVATAKSFSVKPAQALNGTEMSLAVPPRKSASVSTHAVTPDVKLAAIHEDSAESANALTPSVSLKANQRQTPRDKFTELISAPHLSPWFLCTAAFIAVGLGGLHGLEPGHGKTVVAAYLVGSRGTALHAVLLGLIVTVSHTAGVFALGAITLYASRYILPEQLYPWLGLFSGITIVTLGCYMAMRRLTGTASDHSHAPGEARSHFEIFKTSGSRRQIEAADSAATSKSVSLGQLFVLGITGGIIPCPAALIVLLSAFALHRVGLGFFLIVAFSVGLAAVLISFGMLMVFARRFMSGVIADGPLTRLWLPLASSVFIVALGIGLTIQAMIQMHLHITTITVTKEQMGPLLFVIVLGLILGMRHSTDADHVVAISTIVTKQKSIRGAAMIGTVWGIGHTITIFIVGALIILFHVEIPPRVGLSMEFCVALMLVLLGVLNLTGAMQKITQYFTPAGVGLEAAIVLSSAEQTGQKRKSWLTGSTGGLGIYHYARPLTIGLVHGLAGSAAVALLVLSTIHDPMWATLYLLIFGGGTMVGMMFMTTAIATPLTFASARSAKVSSYLGTASGVVSLCFGAFLVYQLGIVGGLFTSHPQWTPH